MDTVDINPEKLNLLHIDEVVSDTLIDQRSELAQEIISRKPGFVEKWALLLFLLIIMIMGISTFYINYPDVIEGSAIVVAVNSPKAVICKQEGRVVKLLEKNENRVSANDIIAYMESTADHTAVLKLENSIDSCLQQLRNGNTHKAVTFMERNFYRLGEIQGDYQIFNKEFELYKDYFYNGFYEKKRANLMKGLTSLRNIDTAISTEILLSDKDMGLTEASFNMNTLLHDQKVISPEGMRLEEAKLINKKILFQQLEVSHMANGAQISQKMQEITQQDHDKEQQKVIFEDALLTLKTAVDAWKHKFLIQAPITGKLIYTIPIKENQVLNIGKLIGYVNPEDTMMYAETYLSQHNFGKIKVGLPVYCQFDAYSYREFGYLKGNISYISSIPSDSGFFAIIRIDNNLKTVNGEKVFLQNGLKAQTTIITKDTRLSSRILEVFKHGAN
ncbi:HlyD family efflux transporter periplasmic adaptor subunit [Chitinophaga sp. LS1]|uniref:HlyD family efflux transporter periplasmic adaptor subunit n=1 Tax=Chitinophaga sp. LS1 TaxID=3051176 RepID=UPI002AAA9C67|nr:HlyD family efflux transporter periplasmic adaptor subunit [Chitinophaga sp. LS1]WPV64030.1 HlyD family efflux transporter periplasmic adaptor subunit [Chitinophaga sp. LS1]